MLCDRKSERGNKGEGLQDSGKTGTGERDRDMGIEEGTGKEIGGVVSGCQWMCRGRKLGRIINERIKGTTQLGGISQKVQEIRLKWYGHVMQRKKMEMEVQGRRKRGRSNRRWLDRVRDDIKECRERMIKMNTCKHIPRRIFHTQCGHR